MKFKRYQKVRRFGTVETEGIEVGTCFIFPKLDGTNASCWLDGDEIKGGSRNRELTLEKDNRGFYKWLLDQDNIKNFLLDNPKIRLYGEWLVKHTLNTYREDAWKNFYVFDVSVGETCLPYNSYEHILDEYNINYISPLASVVDGDPETFTKYLDSNTYLIEDGEGVGEGVVIKNYGFINKFGRTQFAKLRTNKFKESHGKTMGTPTIEKQPVERKIAQCYITEGRVEKMYQKIKDSHNGWRSKYIPELLGRVYHDFIEEEAYNFIKEYNKPTIDFKKLQAMVIDQIKHVKPEVF